MSPKNRFKGIPMFVVLVLVVAAGCGGGPSLEAAPGISPSGAGGGHADDERCTRHGLLATTCFICDPALRDPARLWCREHDRYEDRCFLCHPELEDPNRLWCSEHNLYEDECFLCHPESGHTAGQTADPGNELECQEHGVLERECGICHPELAADLEPGSGLKIRFESTRSAARAGILTARPEVANDRADLTFLARVTWDQNRFARVTPLAGGVLRRVTADVGQNVSKGDLLATVVSPAIAQVKGSYLSARADEKLKLTVLNREKQLVSQKVSALQELEQARAEHEIARNTTAMARQQLLNFGLTERSVLDLEETGSTSSELEILAPLSGTIVDRHAVPGEAVEPGDALFQVANLSAMWLELSIPEAAVSQVSPGQEVVVTFDAQPGLEAAGRVTWVGSSVDGESRMVTGRAEVPNPVRMLRHGMFGQARVFSQTDSYALHVPAGAVQHIDANPFVFLRLADDLFEARRVVLGGSAGDKVAVTDGIGPDDEVVVTHSFTMKSELPKSRLGAGCVDE